ncbi:sugar transferase [Bogoriella caseilytica]|uniref:Undecaprenyl-phosphate galactose phosphotransferase WbaP/exopolysaccharide biosynthesis polyprenyl glycosylphosphotransferase n=1 Tax=Bogoriella caseilytica TaxID=56055 RepID=A0A3N2BDL9_9MICO|nr:sugar transferase [Bogoriella caseilytica]ROR73347.1 Undecaprenyl-phosphate galactose phosphotransferase WbaP/exopolysaccharide biosynthesis polyprenyl glycosylphosphotransferase [Bogoriella caseilytica]
MTAERDRTPGHPAGASGPRSAATRQATPHDASVLDGTDVRPIAWFSWFRFGVFATDVVMIATALIAAQYLRFGEDSVYVATNWAPVHYGVTALGIQLVWVIALAATDSRSSRVLGVGIEEYRRVLVSTVGAFGAVAVISYLLQLELSRLYFIAALPIGLALLLAGRFGWRLALSARRARARAMFGTVIVGGSSEVETTRAELARAPHAGYLPVGAVVLGHDENPEEGLPRIPLSDLPALATDPRVGAVMVTGSVPRETVRQLAWHLETVAVELIVVPRLTDVAGPRMHVAPVGGLPMVHVDLPEFTGFAHAVKRLVDILGSFVALLILLPAFAVIALAIKLDDGGAVFFRQQRVGRDGRTFTMHKFRSMITDAEKHRRELEKANEGSGALFKLKRDPRVTRVGAVLRRYSLDEFPQFWDVLRGAMSLVGPRPPLAQEVASYEEHVHRRLLTKPGITGPWQISGRSDLSWEESVRLDLSYVENWSVAGDIVILFKTVRAILKPNGAY